MTDVASKKCHFIFEINIRLRLFKFVDNAAATNDGEVANGNYEGLDETRVWQESPIREHHGSQSTLTY